MNQWIIIDSFGNGWSNDHGWVDRGFSGAEGGAVVPHDHSLSLTLESHPMTKPSSKSSSAGRSPTGNKI